ncbi:LITAF domain-containing protein-like [Hoplias malabaricus]|uniref:LITAF domain-containing protein-like n=1 Tax=Hoplias malabaricus TaxID=27720 RepID=UPI0034632BBD
MAMMLQPMPERNIVVIEPEPTIIQPVVQPAVMVQSPPVTVVQQVQSPVVVQPRLGETPGRMRCNFCHQEIVTVTRPINGLLTWTVFGALLVLLIWPCCLIPFFVSSCKDVEHSCPNCHNVITIHKRM